MAVSIDEARRAARLARLALDDGELEMLAADLSAVLGHFESVAELTSAGAEGRCVTTPELFASGSDRRSDSVPGPRHDVVVRQDAVGVMLTAEEALRNAPESEDGQFSVPGFLPDEP